MPFNYRFMHFVNRGYWDPSLVVAQTCRANERKFNTKEVRTRWVMLILNV